MGRIAGNQRMVVAEMDRLRLDALLYPVDGRGGARSDESPDITCFIASTAGLPAAAFPIGLDARALPVGLELLGRPHADEALLAMMAAFERARTVAAAAATGGPRRPRETRHCAPERASPAAGLECLSFAPRRRSRRARARAISRAHAAVGYVGGDRPLSGATALRCCLKIGRGSSNRLLATSSALQIVDAIAVFHSCQRHRAATDPRAS